MVRSTTKTKAKGKTNDGTTARIELSVSRVVIQSPRSASKTNKAKPIKSSKTSTPKSAGKKRTK